MNDHHNPNAFPHEHHFRKGLSNFVCQTVCLYKINQSINQASPQLQFSKIFAKFPNLSRTHHTLQAKVESFTVDEVGSSPPLATTFLNLSTLYNKIKGQNFYFN
jgi:hypothetical protein